jgi:hypothetical protein
VRGDPDRHALIGSKALTPFAAARSSPMKQLF